MQSEINVIKDQPAHGACYNRSQKLPYRRGQQKTLNGEILKNHSVNGREINKQNPNRHSTQGIDHHIRYVSVLPLYQQVHNFNDNATSYKNKKSDDEDEKRIIATSARSKIKADYDGGQ